MTTRRFDSQEEPFIGSLRERIEQTKAENARARASSPAPVRSDAPPTEEALRAMRKSRALAVIADSRPAVSGLWPVVLLIAALLIGGVVAVKLGWLTVPAPLQPGATVTPVPPPAG